MTTFSITSAARRSTVAMALACAMACSTEPEFPPGNGTISTSTAGTNLRIHNVSSAALRIAVVTRAQYDGGLAQYCFGVDFCGLPLPARQFLDVGREGITGASESPTPVYVFYWRQGFSDAAPAEVNRIDAALPPMP